MSAPSRAVKDPQDRIIVALDVPSEKEAMDLVEELGDQVSFFKLGLELLMAGALESLLTRLGDEKKVFVDLKLPNDVPTTVERVVKRAADFGVKFLTLSNSATQQTIEAAKRGRGERTSPELLSVPILSSMDRNDFAATEGHSPDDFETAIAERTQRAKTHGVDGFIVSGQEIALFRKLHPAVPLVSPGIRPSWASTDDHKRSCTPSEALRWGTDYLVIGRPIRDSKDRKGDTQRIIDEIASVTEGDSSR